MSHILEILQTLRPDADYTSSTDFIEDYLLDSLDIVTLTATLEEKYSIQISTDDMVPENYQSVEAIATLVRNSGGTI